MSFQKLLKLVDDRSKDSVFGYIRQSRKNTDDTAIPMMIQYCCLKYYFINAYFTKCGDGIQINETGNIVSSFISNIIMQKKNRQNIQKYLFNSECFLQKR